MHDAFLQAIIDDPADDTPRLIYADWLDEHDEGERAEFIRVQCELEPIRSHGHGSAAPHKGACIICMKVARLERRERKLLDTMIDTSTAQQRSKTKASVLWAQPALGRNVCVWPHVFRRGFVAEISLTCADFAGGECLLCYGSSGQRSCTRCNSTGRTPGHAGALFAAAPIEKVTLTDRQPVFIRMSTHGASFWRWFDGSRYLRSGDERTYIDFPADIDPDELPGSLWKVYDGLIEAQEEVTWEHRSKEEALQWLSAALIAYGRAAADGKARKGTTLAGDEAEVQGDESTVRARAAAKGGA